MTQNIEKFMNRLMKLISELNKDEAVLKALFKDFTYDESLNIHIITDEYEDDDGPIYEAFNALGIYVNDEREGIIPINVACDQFGAYIDELTEEYDEDEEDEIEMAIDEYTHKLPSNPEEDSSDFTYMYYPFGNEPYFDSEHITWSFDLSTFVSCGLLTEEELNELKKKYNIVHK